MISCNRVPHDSVVVPDPIGKQSRKWYKTINKINKCVVYTAIYYTFNEEK